MKARVVCALLAVAITALCSVPLQRNPTRLVMPGTVWQRTMSLKEYERWRDSAPRSDMLDYTITIESPK